VRVAKAINAQDPDIVVFAGDALNEAERLGAQVPAALALRPPRKPVLRDSRGRADE